MSDIKFHLGSWSIIAITRAFSFKFSSFLLGHCWRRVRLAFYISITISTEDKWGHFSQSILRFASHLFIQNSKKDLHDNLCRPFLFPDFSLSKATGLFLDLFLLSSHLWLVSYPVWVMVDSISWAPTLLIELLTLECEASWCEETLFFAIYTEGS